MFGIIGGSGFYALAGARVVEEREVSTPFGAPSAPVVLAELEGRRAAFLPRHGGKHGLLPSEINYRANIWALKSAGARQIVSVSAVGSLREELAPGHLVVPNQYIDRTKGIRAHTFFGDGLVAHVSTANPVCRLLAAALAEAAGELGHTLHSDKTYVCVEGPRLGTRAESFFLRDGVGADVVGMTNVPEAFLAREAQLSYATLGVVTDYDCWMDDPAHHATVAEIISRFGETIAKAKEVVARVAANPPPIDEENRRALGTAILTPPDARSEAHKKLLEVLTA